MLSAAPLTLRTPAFLVSCPVQQLTYSSLVRNIFSINLFLNNFRIGYPHIHTVPNRPMWWEIHFQIHTFIWSLYATTIKSTSEEIGYPDMKRRRNYIINYEYVPQSPFYTNCVSHRKWKCYIRLENQSPYHTRISVVYSPDYWLWQFLFHNLGQYSDTWGPNSNNLK
jgi:hypothetical protein